MELLVTIILFCLAGFMMFSGSKMSRKNDSEESEKMEKKWEEIKRKK